MAKRKKLREISLPQVVGIVGYTAEEHEEHYKRDYEFNTPPPARTVVAGWNYKYVNEGRADLPPKETALIKGTPHRFKGVRTGNVYGSRKSIARTKK